MHPIEDLLVLPPPLNNSDSYFLEANLGEIAYKILVENCRSLELAMRGSKVCVGANVVLVIDFGGSKQGEGNTETQSKARSEGIR